MSAESSPTVVSKDAAVSSKDNELPAMVNGLSISSSLTLPPTNMLKPKRWQPSYGPLFKAYAFALRSKITGTGDMSGEDKAFFTSTSMQRGVPLNMHDAYTNARIFALANVMQNEKSPVLREDGDSFVRYLESYLDQVEDSSRTDEEKLRNAEEKYRASKREASLQLELAEFKWKEALQRDPTMTLDRWIEKYGYDYVDSCEERAFARQNLRRAQQTGSRDVLRQKELMDSSLNSEIEVPGSNMPCAMGDVSLKTTAAGNEAPKDIVYQPLHVLPGFKLAAQHWAGKGLQDKGDLSRINIDLLQGFTGSWRELGFGDIEETEKRYRRNSKEFNKICSTIQEWKMVLKFTDIQAFDVNRGLWNIASFRSILPDLARTARTSLHEPVFQTTRILLAYNADLVLQLPPHIYAKLFPNEKNSKHVNNEDVGRMRPNTSALDWPEDELLNELFQTFPFAKVTKEDWDGENELHIRGQLNNLYPTVLGVLARKI